MVDEADYFRPNYPVVTELLLVSLTARCSCLIHAPRQQVVVAEGSKNL